MTGETLEGLFAQAGLDFESFAFSPDEQKCISGKISKLRDEGKPHDQAVAIAISMCAPSKAKASMAGTFSLSESEKINLHGADYDVIDTGDGYFTIKDFPVMSVVKKGTKNAPADVDEKELAHYVAVAQERYQEKKRCAPAFIRHNPLVDFGPEPEFSGYVLPNRVGAYKFDDGEKPTVFADVKVNAMTLQKLWKGELPAHSPEVHWGKRRITGLAFLSTRPPHFEFENNTIGKVSVDRSARFETCLDEYGGLFMADKSHQNTGQKDTASVKDKKKGADVVDVDTRFASYDEKINTLMSHVEELKKAVQSPDDMKRKPDARPVETGEDSDMGVTKMQDDPKMAAQFAAQQDEISALKKRLDEREAKEQAKALADQAIRDLERFDIGDATIDQIGLFASRGKDELDRFVAHVKEIAKERPPANMAEFQAAGSAIEESNPTVAKFQSAGPEEQNKVRELIAQFRAFKKTPFGRHSETTEEQWVDFELSHWKAQQEG